MSTICGVTNPKSILRAPEAPQEPAAKKEPVKKATKPKASTTEKK